MAMNLRNLLTIALALLLSAAARAQVATSETSEKTPLLWPASLEKYHKRFAVFDKEDAENMPAMTEANKLCKELCDRLPHATFIDVSEGILGEWRAA